jgi:hypothetical protein
MRSEYVPIAYARICISLSHRHRLVQLVGNLVANAMTYGAPDRVITVTSAIETESFTVSVHNWDLPFQPLSCRNYLNRWYEAEPETALEWGSASTS